MNVQTLYKETLVKADIEAVWRFFSSPHNLARITPPYLRFRVTSCPDVSQIFEGMLIKYKVSPVLGIPLIWTTEIRQVVQQSKFTDIQLRGPFSLWEHEHTFVPHKEGVLMTDQVRYVTPLGILGNIANALFVKKQVEGIFEYREKVISRLFPDS